MTSHKDHSHPATAAARKACRRNDLIDSLETELRSHSLETLKKLRDSGLYTPDQHDWNLDNVLGYDPITGYAPCIEQENHCSSCGSIDLENLDTIDDPDLQGYTLCCNEPVARGICNGTHKPPLQ